MDKIPPDPMLKSGDAGRAVFMVLMPTDRAYSTVARVARLSPAEKSAKDFVDLLENVGVLRHFGPVAEEMLLLEDDENWRELLPDSLSGVEVMREVYTGGKAGQKVPVIYVLGDENRDEVPRWKQLMERIVERFF